MPFIRVRNSHEPIIDPEVFDRVQELLALNCKTRGKVYSKHPFAGKIICGDCGEFYGLKVWRVRSTGERYSVWYCNHKYDGATVCQTEPLKEDKIKGLFETILQTLGMSDHAYSHDRWNKLVQSFTVYSDGRLHFALTDGREGDIEL